MIGMEHGNSVPGREGEEPAHRRLSRDRYGIGYGCEGRGDDAVSLYVAGRRCWRRISRGSAIRRCCPTAAGASTTPIRPAPPVVHPATAPGGAPADATILFDGRSLDAWTAQGAPWVVKDGAFTARVWLQGKRAGQQAELRRRPAPP
ncbi:hypothetical protein AB5I41_11315 [Sphingomonas sp. MMS24-JH45]